MAKQRIPVQAGKDYTIAITGLGHSGEGVGKYEDFTVFVPFALPGERVRVRMELVKKTYGKGKLLEILEASPDRQEPECPYYGRCGGCQMQHMTYEAELRAKQAQVEAAVRRIGKSEAAVLPAIGASQPRHYRNKMQLPVGREGNQLVMGCYAQGSHRIIHTEHCYIQREGNNAIAEACWQIAMELGAVPYDETTHTGCLRHIIGRVSAASGEAMVILVTAEKRLPKQNEWIEAIRRRLPFVVSIAHNYNPDKTNVIMGRQTKNIWGKEKIEDTLEEFVFSISPASFFQINNDQTVVLYNTALEYADLTGTETVIDAYCGTGTISLFMAKQAAHVIGIEIVPPAIADAKENARRNTCANTEFIVADAAEKMPELYQAGIRPEVIVFDPIRAGCKPAVLESAAAMKPQRIVYVSCNPQSMARDIAYLEPLGYKAVKVQPVDMFPRSSHIECVCLLVRMNTELDG